MKTECDNSIKIGERPHVISHTAMQTVKKKLIICCRLIFKSKHLNADGKFFFLRKYGNKQHKSIRIFIL